MTTALAQIIKSEIAKNGAMPISRYIERCLYDEKHGYYTTRQVFGAKGDFITAPEISQMFGELLGAWAIDSWIRLGKPENFNLIEIGPGRGTLMADMIRSFKSNSAFMAAAKLNLVEVSPRLKAVQQKKLHAFNMKIEWHEKPDALLKNPFILIGNELLDALPFEQYEKTNKGWMKRVVDNVDGAFHFALSDERYKDAALPDGAASQPVGAIFEASSQRENLINQISKAIAREKSAALLIDYGHAKTGFGDTFQALKDNQFCDVLSHQGEADLTNHVDFEALQTTAQNHAVNAHDIITQGDFLIKLGLLERAGQLGFGKNASQQDAIRSAVERLAGNDPKKHQMGDLFKTIILAPSKITLAPFCE